MGKDELTLKGRSFMMRLILHSGGIKNFIVLEGVIGFFCILFSLVTKSLFPFWFFVLVTTIILVLLVKLALSPKGWAFFLESNYLYQVIRTQMELTGDKKAGLQKLENAKLVQPIVETTADVKTIAKIDQERAVKEKRVKLK